MKFNKFLENIYHKLKFYIPERFLYSSSYFKVRNLLLKYDDGLISNADLDALLKEHLLYCLNKVPYYRDNVSPLVSEDEKNNLSGILLLEKFPFLSKETVNSNVELFLSDDFNKKRLLHKSSGGSSGVGIQVWNNKEFTDVEKAFFDHEWGKFGFNFRKSKILRFGSDILRKEEEYPCEIIGRKLCCSPYHFNQKWLGNIVSDIEDFQPEVLHGYPSLVHEYLNYLKLNNKKLPISLRSCFLASEPVLDFQLSLIREFFGNRFSINYGLTERNIIAFSYIDNEKLKYKVNSVYGYAENISNGELKNELVGTSYWNKVMPLVRYQTKDYGKLTDNIIDRLEGRSQDFLVTKDNTLIPGMSVSIDKFIWKHFSDIQIVQRKKGKIIFNMVSRPNVRESTQVVDDFLESQNEKWSSYFDISVEIVESINLTPSGKKLLIKSFI